MNYIGVDLGQRQDHSALAIVERPEKAIFNHVDWRHRQVEEPDRLVVRHLERMELGTPYLRVAQRVAEVAKNPALGGKKILAVDATGVGMPVVEMLVAERPGCEVRPVVMTGGVAEHHDGRIWHVPKLDLMAGLREWLERGELKFAGGMRETETLARELMSVKVGVRSSGRERVGADGCGEHDDLVIAVALACWAARRGRVREAVGRLFW